MMRYEFKTFPNALRLRMEIHDTKTGRYLGYCLFGFYFDVLQKKFVLVGITETMILEKYLALQKDVWYAAFESLDANQFHIPNMQ